MISDNDRVPIKNAIFISPEPSPCEDGTAEHPFSSVKAAQTAAREIIKKGLEDDLYLLFGGGTYYLTEPIVIGPDDCDGKFTVHYAAAGSGTPRLIGGIPVAGWSGPDSAGVISADINRPEKIYSLYLNGSPLSPAREYDWKSKPVKDISHLQAVYNNPNGWFGEILKINSFNGEGFETDLDSCPFAGPVTFLQGAREYISEPGEWAIEGSKIHYLPKNPDDIINGSIIAGISDEIFTVRGEAGRVVRNIVISGFSLSMNAFGENLSAHARPNNITAETDGNLRALVSLSGAENVTVTKCRMSSAGYTAVSLKGYNQNNNISGNDIRDTGYAGIFLFGENPGSLNYCSRHNTVKNNRITHVGLLVGHGAGIYLMNSGENLITHNEISDVPRYGVSMKGIRYGVFADNGLSGVPFDEHWKYNQTTGNVISYNIIHDTGKASADGGGVEGWGIGRDNVIDHNIIYNAYRGKPIKGWRGHSVFLDDAAHYTTVTNNIIYDESAPAVNAGIFIKSIHNVVVNNIFDVGYQKDGAANIKPYICPAGDSVFERNIVFSSARGSLSDDGSISDGESDRVMFSISDESNGSGTPVFDSLRVMNRNLYYNEAGKTLFSVGNRLMSLDEWKSCPENKNGYDSDSIAADPLFIDPENHDYRLRVGSPALKIGFEPINADEIGPAEK